MSGYKAVILCVCGQYHKMRSVVDCEDVINAILRGELHVMTKDGVKLQCILTVLSKRWGTPTDPTVTYDFREDDNATPNEYGPFREPVTSDASNAGNSATTTTA